MSPPAALLKCRFCNFTTAKFHTTKSGKKISGCSRLHAHVEDEHPTESDDLRQALNHLSEYEDQPE